MDNALALAAAQLQKAKTELDLAKSQYQGAEAAFQCAKTVYKALEASLKAGALPDPPQNFLCISCQAIPIASIFKGSQSTSKSHRRNVGDLFHAVETQSSCLFCKFLIEAFQVGSESRSERLHAQLKPRDTAIYFASDPDGKAWYTKAGIDTTLSPCPFVWLQTGAPTATGEPHICISFEPALQKDSNIGRLSTKAYPRQREPLEAFNGSVNYALVKSWLQKCCAEHGNECQVDDTVSALALDIYLIDVKARHLVRRRSGDRFVALSYVWGKQPQRSITLNGDTTGGNEVDHRSDPNFVQDLPVVIPQAMEDAIRFVDHIGERFLWIDQLCIDQTKGEHKQKQINIMDQIFTSAHLTLVNLDGPNAD